MPALILEETCVISPAKPMRLVGWASDRLDAGCRRCIASVHDSTATTAVAQQQRAPHPKSDGHRVALVDSRIIFTRVKFPVLCFSRENQQRFIRQQSGPPLVIRRLLEDNICFPCVLGIAGFEATTGYTSSFG